jgi:hypothetical protein
MIADYLGKKIKVCKETALYGGSFNYDLTVYEPEKLQRFLDEINKQDKPVLLDIGASTGSYSMLGLFNDDLITHSFEPCEKTYDALLRNLLLNDVETTAWRYAISDQVKDKAIFNQVQNDSSIAQAHHQSTKKLIRFMLM